MMREKDEASVPNAASSASEKTGSLDVGACGAAGGASVEIPAGKGGLAPAVELVKTEGGLSLRAGDLTLTPDFADMLPRLRPGALNRELLVRACRIKGLIDDTGQPRATRIIDATAGLGEDSLLLAASGAEVLLCESDPVICALLRDTCQRASHDERLAKAVSRMTVHEGDSISLLRGISGLGEEPTSAVAAAVAPTPATAPSLPSTLAPLLLPDIVYLDPMFPERRKSAAVKKKFQLLHYLEAPCENDEELLQAALAAKPRRVVVKRPIKGPFLAGIKPSYSLAGKAVRFDVIVQ